MQHNENDAYGAAARQMKIQQAAAAAANEAGSAEALAAEAARQDAIREAEAATWRKEGREQCIRENRPIEQQYLEPSPVLEGGVDAAVNAPSDERDVSAGITAHERRKSTLAERLAVEEEEVPEDLMGGAHLVRWLLTPSDDSDGWTLGLSTESHEDEQPDAVYLEVTQAMMRKWRNAPPAAKDLERFAAGLMEKVADALAEDLTDRLIECLERITRGELREKQSLPHFTGAPHDHILPDGTEMEPTRTSVGEDVEPFTSLEDYVIARDAYTQTMSAREYTDFLDANQHLEDEIERRSVEDA